METKLIRAPLILYLLCQYYRFLSATLWIGIFPVTSAVLDFLSLSVFLSVFTSKIGDAIHPPSWKALRVGLENFATVLRFISTDIIVTYFRGPSLHGPRLSAMLLRGNHASNFCIFSATRISRRAVSLIRARWRETMRRTLSRPVERSFCRLTTPRTLLCLLATAF